MNYDNHLAVNNICFQEGLRQIVSDMKKMATPVLCWRSYHTSWRFFLSRQANLHVWWILFLCVFSDEGSGEGRSPNNSLSLMLIHKEHLGSQRILAHKSTRALLFSSFFFFYPKMMFEDLITDIYWISCPEHVALC